MSTESPDVDQPPEPDTPSGDDNDESTSPTVIP